MADVRDIVRDKYGQMAKRKNTCCGTAAQPVNISRSIGYSESELKSVPDDADLGLGCGNPTALASLKAGEVVLDLGSGGGLDCFLAAEKVGETGRVIGVDMTPEMISLARKNAEKGKDRNVEFRLGEIENLPVADSTVDVVISNCVINLSPDKERVFREAYRALRPGGRLMVSDIVLLKPLPDPIKKSIDAYIGCVAGALLKEDYLAAIRAAGFKDVEVQAEKRFGMMVEPTDPFVRSVIGESNLSVEELKEIAAAIVSIQVQGSK